LIQSQGPTALMGVSLKYVSISNLVYFVCGILEWRRVFYCSSSWRHSTCRNIWTSSSAAKRVICAVGSSDEVDSVSDGG